MKQAAKKTLMLQEEIDETENASLTRDQSIVGAPFTSPCGPTARVAQPPVWPNRPCGPTARVAQPPT